MVMCNTMDTAVIPRPPALPLGPIVPNYPLKSTARKGPSLPPPPPPPKPPSQLEEVTGNNNKEASKTGENGEKKMHKDKKYIEERRIIQKMVEKNIAKNESVRSKMSARSAMSQRSNGFRLIDNDTNGNHNKQNPNQDETSSVYSIYKQKIDSMFESDSSTSTNHNSVQAKIEKMFTDVAADSGIPASQLNMHAFSVDYLGSVPLQDKVTSLAGLQQPLRDLYFAYKKMTKSKKTLSGRLEISNQGLRVQYQGTSGDLEQMNSFPTIAVWSAVKFVIQETSSMLHGNEKSYAFLPLITDPDNTEKQTLFRTFHESEVKYITANEQHSPLFAVVMRKIGVQKQLECHGFVCQTSEDAIVIAATLYKSLVNHMKHKEKKPKNKNGVTCISTASSTMMGDKNSMPVRPPRRKRSSAASSICSDSNSITNISDTQPLLTSKPLKKSTKSKRAPKAPSDSKEDDLDAIVPYEEPIRMTSSDEALDTRDGQEECQESKPKSFSGKLLEGKCINSQ
ncbi:unnamed protein product [Ceutorhynchus assimilis]|uniref:PID domain-containing protein n=1 Tax=Ceutorhynchus assimilis TaxID=467358 RepID=A0A9N9MQ55_9CUCU|nr:unnamed protein product [Ceutorhynchus assimilis]